MIPARYSSAEGAPPPVTERTEGRSIRKGPLLFGLALALFASWIAFLLFWAGRLDRALHRGAPAGDAGRALVAGAPGAAGGAGIAGAAAGVPAFHARLSGMTLSSPEPARLRRWYADRLGLRVVEDGADRVVLDAEGVTLEIVRGRGRGFLRDAGAGFPEGLASITLEVADLDVAAARLGDDARVAGPGPDGRRLRLARDPDGNLVRLVARDADARPDGETDGSAEADAP